MSALGRQFRQQRLFAPVGMRRTPSAPHGPAQVDLTPGWHRGVEEYHQTRALMPTREVIDTVHKIDSELMMNDEDSTPAAQWDDVRPEKSNRQLDRAVAARAPLPPIRVQHRDDAYHSDPEPELWDGHHRLAAYEKAGHTEVPVWESFDNTENGYDTVGGGAGGGYSGANPWWSPR